MDRFVVHRYICIFFYFIFFSLLFQFHFDDDSFTFTKYIVHSKRAESFAFYDSKTNVFFRLKHERKKKREKNRKILYFVISFNDFVATMAYNFRIHSFVSIDHPPFTECRFMNQTLMNQKARTVYMYLHSHYANFHSQNGLDFDHLKTAFQIV